MREFYCMHEYMCSREYVNLTFWEYHCLCGPLDGALWPTGWEWLVYSLVYRSNTAQKQACRRPECKWHELKLEILMRVYMHAIAIHFSNLISNNKLNLRFLFDTEAKLGQKQPSIPHLPLLYLVKQIGTFWYFLSWDISWTGFSFEINHVSHEPHFRIDNHSKILDNIFKQHWPSLEPTILNRVNLSLTTDTVPTSLKVIVAKPLLMKPHLDPESLNNYRPVSNL